MTAHWSNLRTEFRDGERIVGIVEEVERFDHLWEINETKYSTTWIGRDGSRCGRDFNTIELAKAWVEGWDAQHRQRAEQKQAAE